MSAFAKKSAIESSISCETDCLPDPTAAASVLASLSSTPSPSTTRISNQGRDSNSPCTINSFPASDTTFSVDSNICHAPYTSKLEHNGAATVVIEEHPQVRLARIERMINLDAVASQGHLHNYAKQRAVFRNTVHGVNEIVQEKLYKARGMSLEEYFKSTFGISRAQVYRVVDSAAVIRDLEELETPNSGVLLPIKQRVCATIKSLAHTKRDRQELWKAVCNKAVPPLQVTSKEVKETWDILVSSGRVGSLATQSTTTTHTAPPVAESNIVTCPTPPNYNLKFEHFNQSNMRYGSYPTIPTAFQNADKQEAYYSACSKSAPYSNCLNPRRESRPKASFTDGANKSPITGDSLAVSNIGGCSVASWNGGNAINEPTATHYTGLLYSPYAQNPYATQSSLAKRASTLFNPETRSESRDSLSSDEKACKSQSPSAQARSSNTSTQPNQAKGQQTSPSTPPPTPTTDLSHNLVGATQHVHPMHAELIANTITALQKLLDAGIHLEPYIQNRWVPSVIKWRFFKEGASDSASKPIACNKIGILADANASKSISTHVNGTIDDKENQQITFESHQVTANVHGKNDPSQLEQLLAFDSSFAHSIEQEKASADPACNSKPARIQSIINQQLPSPNTSLMLHRKRSLSSGTCSITTQPSPHSYNRCMEVAERSGKRARSESFIGKSEHMIVPE